MFSLLDLAMTDTKQKYSRQSGITLQGFGIRRPETEQAHLVTLFPNLHPFTRLTFCFLFLQLFLSGGT